MVFSSITFLFLFFPLAVISYFITPSKYRNITLLIFSLAFYWWSEPIAFLLLIALTVINYLCGLWIHRIIRHKRIALIPFLLGLVVDVGSLIVFKYQLFFSNMIEEALQNNSDITELLVPIGISVYVLQAISYLTDIYFRKIKAQKNFWSFALYLTFFPQMIGGPIIRYSDMMNDLSQRQTNSNTISRGFSMFVKGLAKKVFLADTMLTLWETIKAMDYSKLSIVTAWLGIIAFSYAIYFYFSGYSDMARGIAKIFGFEFPINYNYPYVSKNMIEFWRRWNISLTVWCKSNLIAPLGRGKNSFLVTVLKLLVIWAVIGLWYGGHANYLLWGLYMALVIIIEKLFLSSLLEKLPVLIQKIYTNLLILCGWVIFETDSLGQTASYFKAMFTGNVSSFGDLFQSGALIDQTAFYFLGCYAVVLIICIIAATNLEHVTILKQERNHPVAIQWVRIIWETVLFLGCAVYILGGNGTGTSFFLNF